MVAFEDETWVSLYPRVEGEWMEKGCQKNIQTPGYNRRRNTFITLFWPKRNGFIFNTYHKRRSKEFKLHLQNIVDYAKKKRHSVKKKVILFIDHAPCHKTKNVKKFMRRYRSILKVKWLPKRAPNLNPVERLVNKPLKAAVCTNKSYDNIHDVSREMHSFLVKYKQTFRA